MPHRKRIVVPGVPLHITQRGVRRLNIFRDNEDRCVYLRLFAQASRMFDMLVYAYCLMTNHTHFVAVPNHPDLVWRNVSPGPLDLRFDFQCEIRTLWPALGGTA